MKLSLVAFFFSVFVLAPKASAQITGELRGSVLDPTGAAVPTAKVTLRNVETGVTREQTVSVEGLFSFNLIQIGRYEVRAEAPGFRAAVAPADVKAGEITSAQLKLEVGQVNETVTVNDAVSALDTQNAQLQISVSGPAVQEIPVQRNPNLFALTAPGVAPVTNSNPFLGSGSFNSNGGRGRGNNITVDGITATDVSVTGTGGAISPLNFSSIKEVKVITNNFSAEYGRNSSAQVIYITKNGTNEFHGELWDYLQNDKLNARTFFDRSGSASIVRRNEYGFEVGGPVLIPKLLNGKNKAFFHVDYEGTKQRGIGAARIAKVPTPAQLASVTDLTSNALVQQYKLLSDPSGTIQTNASNKADAYQIGARGDVNLSSHDALWTRYSVFDSTQASSGNTFIQSNLPGFGAISTNHPRQATLAETHLFGSAAVNEFRFGFGQSKPNFPVDTPYPLGPRIVFGDASIERFGVWEGLPQGREQRTFQFNDNFSFVKGRHTFKVGGEFYYLQADSVFDQLVRPVFTFANFADFAAGRPNIWQQSFGNSARINRVKNFFAFAQDDWKATRNLTLNLGLRMEWAGGPTESNGVISNLNLDNRSAYGAAGSGPLGLLETGKPSFNSNTNWGPRIGFAYTPGKSQKTVIRGGYGIAYDFIFLNPITNQRTLPPFIVSGVLTGTASFTGDNSYANFAAGTAQFQKLFAAQVGRLDTTVLNFGTINPAIAQNLRNPQVQQWSTGVQREQFGFVFKATYVGTKGTYLPRARDLNLIANPVSPAVSEADEAARLSQFQAAFAGLNAVPTARSNRIDGRYNTVLYTESSANSIYHGAQFEVIRRYRNYLFQANYTFAKSMDDNSDVLGVLINDASRQQDPRNNANSRAVSQFDLQQRLVIVHNYELPFFRHAASRLVRGTVGGWAFSGISTFRSGFPVTLLSGSRLGIADPTTVLGGGIAVRPNVAGPLNFDPKPAGSAGAPSGVVNPSGTAGKAISAYALSLGLSQPLLGNFGNLGRNTFRLNGETNFDWNVFKNFHFWERGYFQIRAEFYNAFNNHSFQDVDRTINSPTFGQYQTVARDGRFIQMAARFVF